MSKVEAPIFDAIVRIDKLPSAGRSLSVNASETERTAIAEAMNILSVERFVANLTIAPIRGGLRALGQLDAAVTQASVVSFEPVPEIIAEEIDRVFLHGPRDHQPPAPGSEIFIDLEDDDFPDHIDGPEVDLSALLLETLALALSPYPRRDGEALDTLGVTINQPEAGPFAGLASLKGKDSDED